MFRITDEPIHDQPLREELANPESGAVVSFEGRIRNHNNGKTVQKLTYQIYPELARNEMQKIYEEAQDRYDIINMGCVQFEGELDIGETGIWIGVSAAHRKDAFSACQYIIDEVKSRLPIWKKEDYEEGESGWVNCPKSHR